MVTISCPNGDCYSADTRENPDRPWTIGFQGKFIKHANGEMQCARCGKYLDEPVLNHLSFLEKYDIDVQQATLKKRIEETHAELIISIFSSHEITSGNIRELGIRPLYNFIPSNDEGKIEIYKSDQSVFAAYYLPEYVRYGFPGEHPWGEITSTLLFVNDELPTFNFYSGTTTVPVPVKDADKLIFTGATVGGITTGGVHVQQGGIHYEPIKVQGHSGWEITNSVSFPDGNKLKIDWSSPLILTHKNNYPGRFNKWFKDYDAKRLDGGNSCDVIWKANGKVIKQPKYNTTRTFSSYIPLAQIMNDLIYGALPDEEFYQKACELAEKKTRQDLTDAARMFFLLDEYKDSKLKREDCYHELAQLPEEKSGGCYVATAVYGSYDCPPVWTLRRYRDDTLSRTWYGRAFIRAYYATSPTLVKWFGDSAWFINLWKPKLDRMVRQLNEAGVSDKPYVDR